MRQEPNHHVIEWIDKQMVGELAISSITVAEIQLGVALLPEGKRKNLLANLVNEMLQDFNERIFDFDNKTAIIYADIVSHCTKQGRTISTEDAQIASIAKANMAILITRNTRDFEMIEELDIFNPFLN